MLILFQTMAQPGGRMSSDDMVLREKQNLFRQIDHFSKDQKMILDGIYDEYAQSMKEIFEEVRKSRNWDEMKKKMEALNLEKNGLVFDILNEEQYAIYQKLTASKEDRQN